MRKRLEEEKAVNSSYSAALRMQMKNSLSLPKEEVDKLLSNETAYVIRFKMPENENIKVHDLIRGEVVVNTWFTDLSFCKYSGRLFDENHACYSWRRMVAFASLTQNALRCF
jgi:glutamyl/glutaminyl-tRNA synthetase